MKNRILTVLLMGLSLFCAPNYSRAQAITSRSGMSYIGTYSSTSTYAKGDVVDISGTKYISLISSNINNAPASTPSDWSVLSSPSSGSSSSFPSTAGLVYATSPTAARVATRADVVSFWGCTGSLQADGTCVTLGAAATHGAGITINDINCSLDGACTIGGSGGGATNFSGLSGVATPSQLPAATTTAQGAVQLPAGSSGNILGSAAMHPASDFDAAGSSIPSSRIAGLSIITPTYSGNLATGLLADYTFYQGSGTTLTDYSGNNNNGTLGSSANAPTWTATGLAFASGTTQNVSLPSALNGVKTIVIEAYLNPVTTAPLQVSQNNTGGYSNFISSSLGAAGSNLAFNVAGFGVPTIYNSSNLTSCYNQNTGIHTYEYVFGTGSGNLDHVYIDGTECSYKVQGSSFGGQTSGNLFIGANGTNPWSSSFSGTMYRMKMYSTQLNAVDSAQIASLFRAEMTLRGVPTAPVPFNLSVPQMHCFGDSITYGATLTTAAAFCTGVQSLLLNQPTYAVSNWGISGISLQTLTASEPNRGALYGSSTVGGASVATVFAGTNDLAGGAAAPLDIYNDLKAEVHVLKQAGFTVFVSTMLSRTGADSYKNAYNNLIRTGIIAAGADAIFDEAADPLIGADGAYTNSCLADGIHPHDVCESHLYNVLANAMNYYFGHHAANPTVVTATTYQMTAADGFVNVQPTADTSVTLPDCTGQTGAVYTINNSQSTYAVTLKTDAAGHTINGVDRSSTGVVVPANGSFTVVDVPLPPATAGCVWQSR